MTRARDVADTQDNLGGAVAPFVGAKNRIINGDFAVAQRGTSFTNTSSQWTLDRWYTTAGANLFTFAQVAGIGGNRFAAKITATGANAFLAIDQTIELNNCFTLQNRTVTISFWAQANNTNAGSTSLNVITKTAAGVDIGVSGSYSSVVTNRTITTTATRYSVTITLPATFGSLALQFATGSASVNTDGFTISGIQLEAGSVATPFTTASGSIGGELALCQRYYYRTTLSPSSAAIIGFGTGVSTTAALIGVRLPVTMRTYPSSTVESSGLWIFDGAFSINTSAGITTGGGLVPDPNMMNILATGSGITQYRPYYLYASTTTAFLGITAEL
jgi:hypothetical protein